MRTESIPSLSSLVRPKISDGVLLLLLVTVTVLSPFILPVRPGGGVLFVKAGDSVLRIDLEEGESAHTVEGPLGEAVIEVRGGQAWLRNSPCPLKICEGMGPVHQAGDVIICIPNRIYIRVEGKEKVDAVSR